MKIQMLVFLKTSLNTHVEEKYNLTKWGLKNIESLSTPEKGFKKSPKTAAD